MKLKLMLAVAGLTALAVTSGTATAGNGDKVTGGGQVLFGEEDVRRSTLAFTAQGTTTAAKGQVQFIDRREGGGQAQVRYHGIVDCVETGLLDPEDENSPGFAVVSGYERGTDPTAEGTPRFLLRVIDNGQPNQGNDMIAFDTATAAADDTCQDGEDDPEVSGSLAKGNAKIRDAAGDTNDPEPKQAAGTGTTLSILGL